MSIEYEVSQDGKRINVFPKGILDTKQTNDYFKELANHPSLKPNAIEIVDFSEVTDFKMSYIDSQNITEHYQKLKSAKSVYATIFIAKSTVAFGISRMFQALHEITNPEHRVFIAKTNDELEDQLSRLQQEI
jgi:hypothetical protein